VKSEMDSRDREQDVLYSRRDRWHAATAGYLGWTMDAFDFFIVIFMVDNLARNFQVSKSAIIWTLTATLAMRPVGALLFGILADRFGRRRPLIANVLFFSVIELLCGFAPNYKIFLLLRILFGIGMGGEWGVGASLAMESAPRRWRGILSGILQSGYSMGYLLAALMSRLILPHFGWRAMFWVGGAPALLALYISSQVKESSAWEQHGDHNLSTILGKSLASWKSLAYLAVLMTLMHALSHGTQDLYPDFLKSVHALKPSTVSYLAILYNVGAIVGGITFGYHSERFGRRRAMLAALALSLIVIPFWSFATSFYVLAGAAILMQVGVQGAWGIIPAHLNELAPEEARGLVPGFAYQIGILLAAPTNTIEFALRDRFGYSWALAGFELVTIFFLAVIIILGTERRGRHFGAAEHTPPRLVHVGAD
jgi:SHS family lactate transporter-like MFS transporter